MGRKTNFAHVPVVNETKRELDELKGKLREKGFYDVTYDELIQIFMEKNRKLALSDIQIREILRRSRGFA